MFEGQISIFDLSEKSEITELQEERIREIKSKNTGCEVVVYDSGVVGVIADCKHKTIVPQGDESKAFKTKWDKKTYFVSKEGKILGIGVGAVR